MFQICLIRHFVYNFHLSWCSCCCFAMYVFPSIFQMPLFVGPMTSRDRKLSADWPNIFIWREWWSACTEGLQGDDPGDTNTPSWISAFPCAKCSSRRLRTSSRRREYALCGVVTERTWRGMAVEVRKWMRAFLCLCIRVTLSWCLKAWSATLDRMFGIVGRCVVSSLPTKILPCTRKARRRDLSVKAHAIFDLAVSYAESLHQLLSGLSQCSPTSYSLLLCCSKVVQICQEEWFVFWMASLPWLCRQILVREVGHLVTCRSICAPCAHAAAVRFRRQRVVFGIARPLSNHLGRWLRGLLVFIFRHRCDFSELSFSVLQHV